MKFSLIYPTRHRPKFVEMALRFLEKEAYKNFEVIISDNYTDVSFSCEAYCRNSSLENIKYVKPPTPVGMVDNWNFALQHATGDYVFYFTDKMFLLPGTLSYVADVLKKNQVEIISWVDSKYTPLRMPDYFGEGVYTEGRSAVPSGKLFIEYDPREELKKKAFAKVSRGEQDASHYARGKICFGGYKRRLVDRVLDRAENLFHDISPDYTSMILGLSLATSAIEIKPPGIVHINTDLSNGGQGAIRDEHALAYLMSLQGGIRMFEDMLVPQLYSSTHNCVAHDYISLRRKYDFEYQLNVVNWLVYINEDLNVADRVWSSREVESRHRQLLENFIEKSMTKKEAEEYCKKLAARLLMRNSIKKNDLSSVGRLVRVLVRYIIPEFILRLLKRIAFPRRSLSLKIKCNKLIDILKKTNARYWFNFYYFMAISFTVVMNDV